MITTALPEDHGWFVDDGLLLLRLHNAMSVINVTRSITYHYHAETILDSIISGCNTKDITRHSDVKDIVMKWLIKLPDMLAKNPTDWDDIGLVANSSGERTHGRAKGFRLFLLKCEMVVIIMEGSREL